MLDWGRAFPHCAVTKPESSDSGYLDDTLGITDLNDLLAKVLAPEQSDESLRRVFKSFHDSAPSIPKAQ
jgi:hypothetical protein